MITERRLRKLQDNIRNNGWRIQHIPWQPECKLEIHNPRGGLTWLLVISGLTCFLGPLLVSGLLLLLASRLSFGRNLFNKFEPVEDACIDREVQEFEDPDSVGSLTKNTFWAPRIPCEFDYRGTG